MLNVLVSYAFMSERMISLIAATQGFIRWTLDSGAFTAYQSGQTIPLEEYMDFCEEHAHLFDHYVALDVCENPKATKVNIETMVKRGLKPMAVLTTENSISEAKDLASISNALCVAGGTVQPMKKYSTRIAKVRDVVGPDVWLHGLGFGRGMKVGSTQINAVDASSWEEGLRWGNFGYFVKAIGVKSKSWQEIIKTPWDKLDPEIKSALVSLNLKKRHLANKNSINRGSVSLVGIYTAYSWLRFTAALQEKGVRFNFATPGYNLVFMNLIIAAKYGTLKGIRWDDCLKDQPFAKETFHDREKLLIDCVKASKNCAKIFNIK